MLFCGPSGLSAQADTLLRDRAGSRTVGPRIETDKGAVQQEDRGHAAIGEALETDCIAGQTRAWSGTRTSGPPVGVRGTCQAGESGVVTANRPSRHSTRSIHPRKPGRA